MNSFFFSRRHSRLSVAGLLLACLSLAVLPAAPAGPPDESIARKKVKLDHKPVIVDRSSPLLPAGVNASNSRVGVMVELSDDPAILSYTSARRTRGINGARVAAKTQIEKIKSAQASLIPLLTQKPVRAKVLFQVSKAYNGIAIMVKASKFAAIEALPGVKAVHALVPKRRTGTNEGTTDLPFLGVPTVWASSVPGIHGEGIKVAVIDTGIDYLHADFGGPGYPEPTVDPNATAPAQYFPNSKIIGGYDFAGDDYDADGVTGSTTPTPDDNPLDNTDSGHGTAVSSVIGGYGLNADGTTYTGAYDGSTDFSTFLLSPGAAPKCQFYAVKVFGKPEGSTSLISEAIDYALDPNNLGDFSDHVDVINMSLGSNDAGPDDPDSVAAANAAAAGIIVCASAGNGEQDGASPNGGQNYYIVGSPSVGNGVLSVAASINDQSGVLYSAAVTVNAPQSIAGTYLGIYGTTSPVLTSGVTGQAVYADPNDGSTALNNAAAVSGNICVIDRGTVAFTTKINNAIAAGAIGVIIVNNRAGAPIEMSTTGTTASIPAEMISQADGQTIEGLLTTTSSSPVNATLFTDNSYTAQGNSPAADTVTSFTSRGPRHGDSFLKPDLTAPGGDFVLEAANKTGDGVLNYDGTSFSCPHVSGEMALLKQLHPTWTVEELMALAMDTATHDISAGATTGASPVSPPGRIGAGRIDEAQAAAAPAVAYNADDSMLISASFGLVEAVTSTTLTKNIKISNKSASPVTYDLSINDVSTVPGVSYSFIGGATTSVTVPANTATTVPVVLSADPTKMRHTRTAADPASSVAIFPDGSEGSFPRYWVSEAGSYLVLTPENGTPGPAMRLSLYAVPVPASAMSLTAGQSLTFPAPTGTFSFTLSGIGVDNTLPQSDPNYDPTMDVVSLVKPFELQYSSEDLGAPSYDKSSDLKYVGITSDYTKTYLDTGTTPSLAYTTITFGIDTYGDASTPGGNEADREIDIDTVTTDSSGNVIANVPDGVPDYVLFAEDLGGNIYLTELYNTSTGALLVEDFVNSAPSSDFDTNVMNNSSISLPVSAADLGLVDGTPSRFNYQYYTFDYYGSLIDTTPILTYDPTAPGLDPDQQSTEPIFYADADGATVSGNYDAAAFRANRSQGLLLIHTHNQSGQHSEVLLQASRPKITSFSPGSGSVGDTVTFSGKNFTGATAVQFFGADAVTFKVVSDTEVTAVVPPGAQTGTVRIVTPGGVATTKTKFVVTPQL